MKVNLNFKQLWFISILFLFNLTLWSCKTEELIKPDEAPKNIVGSWKITKAVQNGNNITSRYNFNDFRINFLDSNKYQLENKLPFIVKENGVYSLDDPQFPYFISFKDQNNNTVESTFGFPITNGKREINLTFSPGCNENIYIYTLQAVNP